MPHWLDMLIHGIVYFQAGFIVLVALLIAGVKAYDWIRARWIERREGLRQDIREWENELERPLTAGEKKSLATYNHG